MSTITLEEAQAKLPELLDKMTIGEELIITRNGQPLAKLVSQARPFEPARRLGTMRGSVLYMAPDFDAPLEDFKEYME
jgi:prevent-host-death family protein